MNQRDTLRTVACAAVAAALAAPMSVHAHFLELIPSTDIVTSESGQRVGLELAFTHPMERGPAMDMAEPVQFGVVGPDGRKDLKPSLRPRSVDGKRAFSAEYRVKRPGDYIFFVEPAPYWEPAERVMIIHYTKVVVDAFGAGEGWDTEVDLPVEITPLARPYGLWTGNLFRGVVEKRGEPVPFAKVEVEWRNDGSLTAPSDPFITQVLKADANGVFSYSMPRAGWWGFAALLQGVIPMKNPDGREVPVEAGALIWVHARDMR
jgi:cobalt/nickel transport protein